MQVHLNVAQKDIHSLFGVELHCNVFLHLLPSAADAASVVAASEAKIAEEAADAARRRQNITIAFRRASNQDTLEMVNQKAKYWKPQLELTSVADAKPFGALTTVCFGEGSPATPLPAALRGAPAFVTLSFRDAFFDMNFAWARHVFEYTSSTASVDGTAALNSSAAAASPPAKLFQVFALEGMVGRMLSNMLIRNTKERLVKHWSSSFPNSAAIPAPASPHAPNAPAVPAPKPTPAPVQTPHAAALAKNKGKSRVISPPVVAASNFDSFFEFATKSEDPSRPKIAATPSAGSSVAAPVATAPTTVAAAAVAAAAAATANPAASTAAADSSDAKATSTATDSASPAVPASAATTAADTNSTSSPAPVSLPPPLRQAGAVAWATDDSRLLAHIGSVDDVFLHEVCLFKTGICAAPFPLKTFYSRQFILDFNFFELLFNAFPSILHTSVTLPSIVRPHPPPHSLTR